MISDELETLRHKLEAKLNDSPEYRIDMNVFESTHMLDTLAEIIDRVQILEETVLPEISKHAPIPKDDPKVVNFNAFKTARTPNKRNKL